MIEIIQFSMLIFVMGLSHTVYLDADPTLYNNEMLQKESGLLPGQENPRVHWLAMLKYFKKLM
jgi:hypothetical protein